jgi:hypothetical protein
VPHSVFTGRVVAEGEPLFTAEDTDAAVALAEEEADTCPQCGYLKVWCRDQSAQFGFRVVEEQCHASYALAAHRNAMAEQRDEATRAAMMASARFVREPDLTAGLDLGDG